MGRVVVVNREPLIRALRQSPTVGPFVRYVFGCQTFRPIIYFVADFVGTQSDRYSPTEDIPVVRPSRLRIVVLSDFASHAEATASHAARAGPTFRIGAADIPRCSHLRRFLLSDDPRILVLTSIAPDGGFLFPHECDITRRGAGLA